MSRRVFTPPNIERMRAMAAEGRTAFEIAQAIGSTPASVRVKCCALKISLGRFELRNPLLPPPERGPAPADDAERIHMTLRPDMYAALKAAADKRTVTPARLARLILCTVLRDNIVDAVLDDAFPADVNGAAG
jgi:hypothetical protein